MRCADRRGRRSGLRGATALPPPVAPPGHGHTGRWRRGSWSGREAVAAPRRTARAGQGRACAPAAPITGDRLGSSSVARSPFRGSSSANGRTAVSASCQAQDAARASRRAWRWSLGGSRHRGRGDRCSRRSACWLSGETAGHQRDRRPGDERLAHLRQPLVVPAVPTGSHDPRQRPFDDPAAGQHNEAGRVRRPSTVLIVTSRRVFAQVTRAPA